MPFAICTVLVFTVPDTSKGAKVVYIVVTYNLLSLAYTAVNIPYGVLNSLSTQNQHQRSLLNIVRMFFTIASSVIVGFVIQPLVRYFGSGQMGWVWTIATLVIFGSVFIYICFRNTEECVRHAIKKKENRDIPIKLGVKYLFRNKYWLLILCLFLNVYFMIGLISGLNIYYAKWILNDEGLVGIMTLTGLVPTIIGLFAIAPFIKRFGKRNTVLLGSVISFIGGVILLINPYSITLLIVSNVIKGLAGASILGTLFAFLADTIEYGEWKSGVRTEGLIYSAGSFGSKVGSGLGAAAMGWMLAVANYDGLAVSRSIQTLNMIIILFVIAPLVFKLIPIVIMWFYKLDKEFPTILADLEEIRRSGAAKSK
ncbi:glycoside-pentoside-hexuronide (GPH):cation symporter [Bacillus cereus]|nr:glycoside-pentoside-hexuronide (GPH):cation symporter [Bacillus cereus]